MQLVLVYDIKKWVTKSRQGKLVGRYASRGSFIQKVTENVQECTRMYCTSYVLCTSMDC